MSRKLNIATVQMDATPEPTTNRLGRAALLVADAAAQGAQLVVLPELFNIGYEYHARNYELAEPIDGPTMTWMKAQAALHDLHLAGSFLLLDGDDIYNSAFIVAPDGRSWRYDKNYPFSWERAYFREGHHTTVADTSIGKLGMLICWDMAHTDLWRRYAGQVDMVVGASCPPLMNHPALLFPDGERLQLTLDNNHFQEEDVEAQARWMRVPVVVSSGAGLFRSHLPMPEFSLVGMLGLRGDWRQRLQVAAEVIVEAGYGRYAKIVGADGRTLARVENDSDGFTVAQVELAAVPPEPLERQPAMCTAPMTYFNVDVISANVLVQQYRQHIRCHFGAHMAPVDPRTKVWSLALGGTAAAAGLAGYWIGRRDQK